MSDSEDYQEPSARARVPGKCARIPGSDPVVGSGSGAVVAALLNLAERSRLLLLLHHVYGCPSHESGCPALVLLAACLTLLHTLLSRTDGFPPALHAVLAARHSVLPSGCPPLSDSASCSQWWLPFSGTADITGLVNLALLTPHTVHDDFRMICDN